ncbi:DUF86 domain-containing protein [Oceanobacillus halotolerans]|uniref:DUF86 domain-containing protein n=1 Tax=Oceanobacillus halotolerans TaxID=2663380 RepID=UPI0013DA5E59|nr:DUF86 domain-containing protein [Oceanobacillus halotolerans]
MYFVDRKKIEETLNYMDSLLEEVETQSFDSYVQRLGLERMVHMVAESTLDVGNMMIDGFIMRDPGSFDDIIDILIDEKVLPIDDKEAYRVLIQLRHQIIKNYLAIDHDTLLSSFLNYKQKFDQFSNHIRTYLDNELGVANAFSKE